jgi:hypothetical protein
VDLSGLAAGGKGQSGLAAILSSLRGEEVVIQGASPAAGRILDVEYRDESAELKRAYLTILGVTGIQSISLNDIGAIVFRDPAIEKDFNKALDLLAADRNGDARILTVSLPGTGSRSISIGYIIPSPVWKTAYRLDLGAEEPFLQGWAIVDNDSAVDWEGVSLSLVSGRPVSFTQNLYPPHYVSRPERPLSLPGIAEGETYERGYGGAVRSVTVPVPQDAPMAKMAFTKEKMADYAEMAFDEAAAESSDAGDQVEFSIKAPVSLKRQESAMLPIVQGAIGAEKALIFSGRRALGGGSIHPALGAFLSNSTGLKLPPGPITVFDGGAYGGDALIEFFPANEKRLISYGEDLTVQGSLERNVSRVVQTVKIQSGVMTIARRESREFKYRFGNSAPQVKRLIIEHPVTSGATLREGQTYIERTPGVYRFEQTLPAAGEISFDVAEETPTEEHIVLAKLSLETILYYASNEEIPQTIKAALTRAGELLGKIASAERSLSDLQNRRKVQIDEQDRIRKNLEAAGRETSLGAEYLRRMTDIDKAIDALAAQTEEAR